MKALLIATFCLSLPLAALAVTVEGKTYNSTATIEGKTLKLVGAGLREKWIFDVYTMGAYTESGSCDTRKLITADEAKYLRIDMLRDVPAKKMAESLGESFTSHLPKNASAELKQQVKTFRSYFKDECSKGTVIEMYYIPGQGTVIKQNKKLLGPPMTGVAFQQVLFDIYFAKNTCCEGLKEDILEMCGKR